jgi:hypothetical protein
LLLHPLGQCRSLVRELAQRITQLGRLANNEWAPPNISMRAIQRYFLFICVSFFALCGAKKNILYL